MKIEEGVMEIEKQDLKYFIKYFKIFVLRFQFPMLIVLLINYAALLFKLYHWYQNSFHFLDHKVLTFTGGLLFLIPVLYAIWFSYRAYESVLYQIHQDFLLGPIKEGSLLFATKMLDKTDLESVESQISFWLTWLNKKTEWLPSILKWFFNKLMNRIPVANVLASIEYVDVKDGNTENLALTIEEKFNETVIEIISTIVPDQFKYLIPFNLLLLLYFLCN